MWKNNASQNGCSNLLASITRTPIRIAPRASAEGKSRLNRVFCSRLSFVALILQPYSSRLRSRQLFIPPLFPRIEIFFFFIQSLRGCNYPLTPDPVHLQSRFFFFFFPAGGFELSPTARCEPGLHLHRPPSNVGPVGLFFVYMTLKLCFELFQPGWHERRNRRLF